MADFDDLMKEFGIDIPEEEEIKPSRKREKVSEEANSRFAQRQDYFQQRESSFQPKDRRAGQPSGGGFGQMSGVFGSGKVPGRTTGNIPGKRTRNASRRNAPASHRQHRNISGIGLSLRSLPYSVIICTLISIAMGIYVICNFETVTWAIFMVIYKLISAGLLIFTLVVIVLVLIIAVRRGSRRP